MFKNLISSSKIRTYCILGKICFSIFFSEKRLKVITRTSVSRNVGKISVEGGEIKKFTNSTENFRDGLALKVNMFIFRRNKLNISEIVNHGY